MNYTIQAKSSKTQQGSITIHQSNIAFGVSTTSDQALPNPAELFLGSLAACILKSVERFSVFMKFGYSHAEIVVSAIRLERTPKLDTINYMLKIFGPSNINIDLLKKNLEQYGTIFNTVKSSSAITGNIEHVKT